MTVVVGILLVVQPPLVFGGSEQDDPAYELHSNDTDDGYRRRNNRFKVALNFLMGHK